MQKKISYILAVGLFGCVATPPEPQIAYNENLAQLRTSLYSIEGQSSESALGSAIDLAELLEPNYGFSSQRTCTAKFSNNESLNVSSSHPLCIDDDEQFSDKIQTTSKTIYDVERAFERDNGSSKFETGMFKCQSDAQQCVDYGYGPLNCNLTRVLCLASFLYGGNNF